MKRVKTPSFELAINAKGDKGAKKLALVLPGRLDTKDYHHMVSHVDFLSQHGYYALSFDPPGTWESPGTIDNYTMTNYLKAINELIHYFGNKPTVLLGHSRGGSMAMLGGIKNPYVTHIIAVMSRPSASIPDDMNAFRNQGKDISYRDMPPGDSTNKVRVALPLSYFEDAAKYDMRDDLANCQKPKLYFLGLHDTTVTPEVIRELFEQSSEPKQLHELDSDHDYRRHPHIIKEVEQVVGKFLEV